MPDGPLLIRRILTALWLYATVEGIASARELNKRCYDCDPFKWIRGGVDVNYHTLSDFRTKYPEWLKEQVVNNIAAIRAEDLADLDTLGQDGMRVRASAGSASLKEGRNAGATAGRSRTAMGPNCKREFEAGDGAFGPPASRTRASGAG